MRQTFFFILITSLSVAIAAAGGGTSAKTSFDIDSIKSYQEIPGVTEEEITAIEALKTSRNSFTYGHMRSTEAFILPDGSYTGFTTKFCELLSELFSIKFIQEFYNWNDLKNGIDNQAIDFTGELTPTSQRLLYYYMTHAIAERSLKLFTYEDSNEIMTESDINGLKIGFLEGSANIESVRKSYPALSFQVINIKDIPDAAAMLKSGQIDAFVSDGVSDLNFVDYDFICSKDFFPLIYTPVSLTTANPELKPIISVINKYISAGGIDTLYELYKQSNYEYAKYKLNMSFTGEEKAYMNDLKARNAKVPLAIESTNYPVSFYNEEDKEFQGIAPDILTEISELTGIGFEVKTTKDTSWAEILQQLKDGDVSMVTQLLFTDVRKDDYIWSSVPYAASRYALLSKSDYPDLKIHQVIHTTVGTLYKSAYADMYFAWFPGSNNTISYDSHVEAFYALDKGDIDLIMGCEYILLAQANYLEKTGYKINISFAAPMDSLFGFNKNEEILCSIINKAQSYIDTDTIASRWTNRMFDYSRKYANDRALILTILAVILSFALISVAFLFLKNKRIGRDLEMQTATLSTIFTSIPDILYSKDLNFNYTSCNPSFEILAGRKEAEIIGKNAEEIFKAYPDMARRFLSGDEKVIRESATQTAEDWYIFPDGSSRLFECVKAPLINNGAVTGVMGISRDITEHKAAEEQAKAASKAKSAFLAHMSHEIRTPINAITGMTELILREDIPSGIYENALSIKQASASLLSIIDDILDFSKIEAGKLEIIEAEYSFTSLINDVISIIRMRITEKPIMFTANIDCGIPKKLIGDETRIRQIMLNILSNAVKYTDEGFISMAVSGQVKEASVILNIEISDSGIGIKKEELERLFGDFIRLDAIKNKGIQGTGLGLAISRQLCEAMGGGIYVQSEYGAGSTFTITIPQKFNMYENFASVSCPEAKQVLLYEPRSVYANSIVRSIADLGARCTLVTTQSEFHKELKRNHYPFVFMSSFLYEGADQVMKSLETDSKLVLLMEYGEAPPFRNLRTMAMPIHSLSIANILNDAADNVKYNENSEINARFTAPSAKVLIVDDVGTNLKVAEGLMIPYKMRIDLCMSGEEAVKSVQENRYDIIFMDHMMPEMDGLEATDKIRSLEDGSGYYKNVPIIALTANAVSGMKEMFLQNGLNDFLAKPIDTLKLNKVLARWIPKEKQKQEKYENEKNNRQPADFYIEGIDVKTAISMTGGTEDRYIKTLFVFYKDGLKKIKEIRDCLKKNDIKLFTTYVHALKSAAASIGAENISDLAKGLEMAGKNEDIAFIQENAESFLYELNTLLHNIGDEISKNQVTDYALPDGDPAFLKNECMKLKRALKDMDVLEIDNTINKLGTKKWDKKTTVTIKSISQSILLFEYEEAIALIVELTTLSERK